MLWTINAQSHCSKKKEKKKETNNTGAATKKCIKCLELRIEEFHLFASVYWLTVAHITLNSGATADVTPNTCALPTTVCQISTITANRKKQTVWGEMNSLACINTLCWNASGRLSWALEDSCWPGSRGSRRCRPGSSSQPSRRDTGLDLAVQGLKRMKSDIPSDWNNTPSNHKLEHHSYELMSNMTVS